MFVADYLRYFPSYNLHYFLLLIIIYTFIIEDTPCMCMLIVKHGTTNVLESCSTERDI